jgi:hypothetical protein
MNREPPGDLLLAVAAHGLPGAVRPLPDAPLEEAQWAVLLRGARRQRLVGHLATAVADGTFKATQEQTRAVIELHMRAMGLSVRLERVLLRSVGLLVSHGIDYRVLKGPVVAHTVYPNPAVREFGDIDILVRGRQFHEAVSVLAKGGWRRPRPELRPGFDRRFGKGATLVDGEGYELDLHRTFAQGPFGLTIDLAGIFAATSPTFRIGGHDLRVLKPEESFLHICYHAVLGSVTPRLVPLRDVAQALLTNRVDDNRTLELARRWCGEAVLANAIATTWETFRLADAVPLSVWAKRYVHSRREERALASYRRNDHPYGAKALAALRVIPGAAAKASYLAALVWPQREALAGHDRSYRTWWGRGTHALLHRGHHS